MKTLLRIAKFVFIFAFFVLLASCQEATVFMNTTTPAAAEVTATRTTLPTATPTEKPDDCMSQPGMVERITFKSDIMEESYTVSVYTPPCYGKDPQAQYPALYLFHGQNMDDTFWLSLGAADIVDRLIANGSKPFLMVMPYEVNNFDLPTESKFGDSIIQELIPWVEENYQVCTERDCRAIGGVSRGGGWAMRLAMRNFDLFSSVGGHSMGPMAGDWWQAQKHLEDHTVDEYPRIFIDRGEDDFLKQDIDSFEKVLASNGIPHEYHVYPGAHNVEYWKAHAAEYLQWYAEGWK